ncbi:A disintegrin and metalloproteinase with thrombospondin motifs like [Microplitis mediator]|uniref:A disintegrin and metalloproteinase with thrombospondin motifs like n=1 Tax=Microplitis mediator TaxID=375433 RepID=UPI002553A231|nr:A disintegrin and metalloproteinase with thrombospondin motifs like [Microplitis mediator]XP_057327762.1 A disintegrin and metalloproteinase with thrombospondin motifs like [Microplitis mediator]
MSVYLSITIFGLILLCSLSAQENNTLLGKNNDTDVFFERHKKLWLNPVYGTLADSNTQIYMVNYDQDKRQSDIREWPNVTYYVMSNLHNVIEHATTLAVNKNGSNYEIIKAIVSAIPLKTDPAFPPIIYPEILVIVDYSLYKKLDGNLWKIVPYLLAFWNGVDMRFRSLNNPRVRLNIAKILIAEDRRALTYTRSYLDNRRNLDARGSINDKKIWLYEQKNVVPLDSYDIAITMTSDAMYLLPFDNNLSNGVPIKGLASGKACLADHRLRRAMNVAIVNDEGAYDGIMAAAHEIGHLLGADHDYDNKSCGPFHGYVMSPYLAYRTTSWNWSPCSQLNFRNFLRSGNGTCLFNKPKEGIEIPRLLPGKLMDANEQCKILGSSSAVELEDFICVDLACYENDNATVTKFYRFGAADGTKCGDGKICLHGSCLYEKSIT